MAPALRRYLVRGGVLLLLLVVLVLVFAQGLTRPLAVAFVVLSAANTALLLRERRRQL